MTAEWRHQEVPASNAFLEYIPGRDTLYTADQLAAGWLAAHRAVTTGLDSEYAMVHAMSRGDCSSSWVGAWL